MASARPFSGYLSTVGSSWRTVPGCRDSEFVDIRPTYNVLDCFSGYGGFALGLRLAYPDADFRTAAYIEWDKYCQQVIQARINDRLLDDAPVWGGSIREFDGKPWRGIVDIITASPPCPSFSVAGNRLGGEDDRNMFPETLRLLDEIRPTYAILENVPGLTLGGRPYIWDVLGGLAEIGLYDCRWDIVSAQDAKAPHKRSRWWCFARLADSGGRR
jgi:DNA (cytosine-5)-methyltransferase 1